MKESNGGLTEERLLEMPWVRFTSYCESIAKQSEIQKDRNYFNGSDELANIWQKNKDKWLPEDRVM